MFRRLRLFCAAALIIAIPLWAQEKPGNTKPAAKDTEKKEEKKEAKKDEPKPTPEKKVPPKRYESAGKVKGKIASAESGEIELTAPGYGGRMQGKQTIAMAEDVKIRTMVLPEKIGDNNKPIPYTQAEKAKLKGSNPKLPGYESELSALKQGVTVEVELGTLKPTPGTPKKKNAEPEKPVATMIVILEETKPADKPKKK